MFELLALKKPMLIIPLEKGSRGDQMLNANIFERENLALTAKEDELLQDENLLLQKLELLYKNKNEFVKNTQNKQIVGNKKIVEQIKKYLK